MVPIFKLDLFRDAIQWMVVQAHNQQLEVLVRFPPFDCRLNLELHKTRRKSILGGQQQMAITLIDCLIKSVVWLVTKFEKLLVIPRAQSIS